MDLIPCYRATHLRPYLDLFREIGAPMEREWRRAGLPALLADRDDFYLPQLPTLDFLDSMARQEGIDELPLRVLSRLEISDLSEQFLARASCAPTLKVALESFRELAPAEDPHVEFSIIQGETTVKLCMLNHFPLNARDQYFEDWNELLVMLTIVRAFAGPSWQPTEMAIRSTVEPGQYAVEQFPDTKFLTGQRAVWITVQRGLLSLPPGVAPDVDRSRAALAAPSPGAVASELNTGSSLKAVLSAYLPDRLPKIELAAEMASTSVRTLQRRLKEKGLSYTDLICELRFDAAARLLRETDASALEVALEVGYDDPSHFSRAFKRSAGVCPREYRRQGRLNHGCSAQR